MDLVDHITKFYKHLFGDSADWGVHLGNEFWDQEQKLIGQMATNLIEPFTEEEVKAVVFDMKTESAPGPNGFGACFFQAFWGTIKLKLSLWKCLLIGLKAS